MDKQEGYLLPIKSAKRCNAVHGWYWINEGFRYFFQAKYTWFLSLFLVLFAMTTLIYVLPFSQLFMVFIFPFFVAGYSMACFDMERGIKMDVRSVVKAFGSANKLNILRYGFWLILLMVIAQMLASIFLSAVGIPQEQVASELTALKENSSASWQSIFDSVVLSKFLFVTLLTLLPVAAINLFAPVVLAFSNFTAFEAIKLSLNASMKNISALLVYAVTYLVFIGLAVIALKGLNMIFLSMSAAQSVLASLINLFFLFAFVLLFSALTYCSAYVAFKDVFLGEEI